MLTPRSYFALLPLLTACSGGLIHPSTPADMAAASPLGPSYVLIPLPTEDDALLGRVLLNPLEKDRSLEEVTRPNECGEKLTPKREGPLASTFEDAQELALGGQARAALGAFGFEGDANSATHFHYKLDVSKRVAQTDTTEYQACCREKGSCGYGFVSALIYGNGQYATASESNAAGSVEIPVGGGAGGFVRAKVLHQRNVKGYVAALVTVTNASSKATIGVLGDPHAAGIELDEQKLPEQVKQRFAAQRIRVADLANPEDAEGLPQETKYVFADGNGSITENEFVRRYQALTESEDLEAANRHRNRGWLIAGLGTTAVSVGLAVLGGYLVATAPPAPGGGEDDPQTTGGIGCIFGSGLLVTPAITFLVMGLDGDGTPTEHSVSKFDAQLYVARYNRALLRKIVRETTTLMQGLSAKSDFQVQPVLAPSFVGVTGTF